jgi:SAM-dependent methyltransferase
MSFVPKDVVLLPESTPAHPDRWVAMNVFARTCLGVSSGVVELLGNLPVNTTLAATDAYKCWDIEWFSNEDGLLADPTRYRRDVAEWKELLLDRTALLGKLKAHFIVIDDETAYRRCFADKRNVLDAEHFGTFHQQHGRHMMLVKRIDPAPWWMQQKFTPDRLAVRSDTLYGAVQWKFIQEFAAERIRPGMRVLDLGCGTGIYANVMAKHGADVLGIDPSDDYLAVARSNAVPRTRFEKMKIGEAGDLDAIPSGAFDLVFMSDALLFYFVPFYPGQKTDIQVLLADIRRVLKPDGLFISLEPHVAFYLTPWLGPADHPFTIVTEYLHKWFGVVPPMSALVRALTNAKFAVTELREIGPSEEFIKVDPRGYHFAREFPLWQCLELRPFG